MSLYINQEESVQLKNENLSECFFSFQKQGTPISSDILEKFLNISPNIEYFRLYGKFSYFNLDNLVRLNKLVLYGTIQIKEFNFEILRNLCRQLISLYISLDNIDDNNIARLFNDLQFPNISDLTINDTKITKLEKELLNGFPNLESLKISGNKLLKIIDHDTFSNLKNLKNLVLLSNCIESLEREHFSELINLEVLDISRNAIKTNNMFSNLNNLARIVFYD